MDSKLNARITNIRGFRAYTRQKEMKKIQYDLIGATLSGVSIHPQKEVERLGMRVLKFEGVPIADCIFMKVDDIPPDLPSYINESKWIFTEDRNKD